MNGYTLEGCLGTCSGNFGKSFIATHKDTSARVVVRQYSLEKLLDETAFIREILVMKHLRHQNLLTYHESFIHEHSLNIVTSLADFGSVSSLVVKEFTNGIPEAACCAILRDVLQAASYLHSKGYIHRNIRASHIMISSQGKALLGGLRDCLSILDKGNWQKTVHDFPQHLSASLCWLSPELLEQNLRGYSQLSDIYSVGITACEMANGVTPYEDLPLTHMLIEKLRGPPPQLWDSSTLPPEHEMANCNRSGTGSVNEDGVREDAAINKHIIAASRRMFSRSFHQFTLLCLQREPSLRPSASHLLKHAFFQHLKKTTFHNWAELLAPAHPITERTTDEEYQITSDIEQIHLSDQFSWDFTVESDL